MIPVAGAVVGGLVGGPIGLLAGFKIAGLAAAVGGGVVGYQGGKYMKRKHDKRVEVELNNLSKNDWCSLYFLIHIILGFRLLFVLCAHWIIINRKRAFCAKWIFDIS